MNGLRKNKERAVEWMKIFFISQNIDIKLFCFAIDLSYGDNLGKGLTFFKQQSLVLENGDR